MEPLVSLALIDRLGEAHTSEQWRQIAANRKCVDFGATKLFKETYVIECDILIYERKKVLYSTKMRYLSPTQEVARSLPLVSRETGNWSTKVSEYLHYR